MKRILLIIFTITVAMTLIIPNDTFANSAEPPSVLIIVPNAPKDLDISLEANNKIIEARKINKVLETYYVFYNSKINLPMNNMNTYTDYKFHVNTSVFDMEINLARPAMTFQNIYTLNLKEGTLTSGKLLSRSILLVSLRLILTLIIEGLVFWRFGFRKRESWIAFLIINLITQGALNIWINGFFPVTSYMFIALIFAEILILITELIAIPTFVKELHKKDRILYVIAANTLSFVIGGFIISNLPF